MKLRAWDRILGVNARNQHIARANSALAVRLVDDKYLTKEALRRAGVPVAPTLAVLRDRREARDFGWAALPDAWALKPNQSLAGNGILLAVGRQEDGWQTASGRRLSLGSVRDHLRLIIDGEFSPRDRDAALFEPLLRGHQDLARVAPGLPDVRVICDEETPIAAMLRLPTRSSGGRANLHQGAVGAALDLVSGRVTAALIGNDGLDAHPDTGRRLIGMPVPFWDEILAAAIKCGPATGLRYLGADIVIDAERGPLVLEVNARPGLQIQNVAGLGLAEMLRGEQ